MANITDSNLKKLCRVCMKTIHSTSLKRKIKNTRDQHQTLEDFPNTNKSDETITVSILELLYVVQPQIVPELEDRLPNVICMGCVDDLVTTYKFLRTYKESDTKFRKFLKQCMLPSNSECLEEQYDGELVHFTVEKIEEPFIVDANEFDMAEKTGDYDEEFLEPATELHNQTKRFREMQSEEQCDPIQSKEATGKNLPQQAFQIDFEHFKTEEGFSIQKSLDQTSTTPNELSELSQQIPPIEVVVVKEEMLIENEEVTIPCPESAVSVSSENISTLSRKQKKTPELHKTKEQLQAVRNIQMGQNVVDRNKANCKRWRESLKDDETKLEDYKIRNRERMRKARQTLKALADAEEREEIRKYNRIRQRERRRKLLENRMSSQSQNEPYECEQTLVKAVMKVEKAMPKDMHRRLQVLDFLVKKYKLPSGKISNDHSQHSKEELKNITRQDNPNCHSCKELSSKFDLFNDSSQKQHNTLVDILAEHKVLLDLIVKQNGGGVNKIIVFPINSEEKLKELDKKLTMHADAYIHQMKLLLAGNAERNLHLILDHVVIMNFNVDGSFGKKRLRDFDNVYTAIINAIATFSSSPDRTLRAAFQRQKKKYFKQTSRNKAKNNEQQENDRGGDSSDEEEESFILSI